MPPPLPLSYPYVTMNKAVKSNIFIIKRFIWLLLHILFQHNISTINKGDKTMPSMEDFLPPKPDDVFNVVKGSVCDVVDGVMDMVKTPIETVEKVSDRVKRLAP